MPAAGVPASVPVPLPLSVNVTPVGSARRRARSPAPGSRSVVTVKVPGTPTVNVVLFALVIAGAWFTVSVKLWTAARADAVGRRERDRVGAAGAGGGRAGERAGAVAVVGEGHAGGSAAPPR